MQRILFGLFGLSMAVAASAKTFTVDAGHSAIGFSVKHMMVSNTKGHFNTFSGTLDYDAESKTLKSVEGTVETASIDTNNEKRDGHLKGADFFHVVQFPQMTFKSTSIKKTGESSFKVHGQLRVLGVEHDTVLPLTITGPIDDPWGNKRIGVEIITVFNRRELGITHSPAAQIGDTVKVSIVLEAIYQK